jgi:hypothetical protein
MRPIGPRTDAGCRIAALDFQRRRIGKIRAMALAGMNHQHAVLARRLQHRADRLDRGGQQRHVVAKGCAEATRLQKVALHIDDDEHGARHVDLDGIWLGFDPDWHSIPRSRWGELRKFGAKSGQLYTGNAAALNFD